MNDNRHNRLWMHRGDEKIYLHTVSVEDIRWRLDDCSATVVLRGLLQDDRFLLDIYKDRPDFEIRTGVYGDPKDYKNGDTLVWLKGTSHFKCWTENVVIACFDEAAKTTLCCQFECKEAIVCDS